MYPDEVVLCRKNTNNLSLRDADRARRIARTFCEVGVAALYGFSKALRVGRCVETTMTIR